MSHWGRTLVAEERLSSQPLVRGIQRLAAFSVVTVPQTACPAVELIWRLRRLDSLRYDRLVDGAPFELAQAEKSE